MRLTAKKQTQQNKQLSKEIRRFSARNNKFSRKKKQEKYVVFDRRTEDENIDTSTTGGNNFITVLAGDWEKMNIKIDAMSVGVNLFVDVIFVKS